jgi:hypothetical protein
MTAEEPSGHVAAPMNTKIPSPAGTVREFPSGEPVRERGLAKSGAQQRAGLRG